MSDLKLSYQPVLALKSRSRNPRTHTKKQIRQIADSIKCFGFTNPILLNSDNTIIAGHGRIEAAKLLQIDTVPVIYLADLSEAEIRAYVIADNKLAENAGWDRDLLALELKGLFELNLDFDLTITGFDAPEIDILLNIKETKASNLADRIPPPNDRPAISRLGDLWLLGRHKLLCGDATKGESFRALLGTEKAQMIFTDPPYNVPIDGHVCGLGKVKHTEFAMASGEMSEDQFVTFLQTAFENLAAFSSDGSIHFICMDWRHTSELMSAARVAYTDFKNLCVWNKTNGGMGSLYRSKHELVFVYKNGSAPHINNVELGKHGRNRTNVWDYAGVNTLGAERSDALAMHPTVKPVSLVADAMLDCSTRGGIVLDCFGGSGTTLIAAERVGRRGYLMEFEPKYVDTIIERYQQLTGDDAVHAGSRLSFNDMCEVLA